MMTFDELKAQLIEQGVPAAVADTVAAGKLADMMTRNTQTIQADRAAVQHGTNKDGLPCVLRKGAKGTLVPCCESAMVVLLPSAEYAKGKVKTEYGPSIVLHYREHLNERGYIAPNDVWVGGQSSASIQPPEESGAWQMAELLAKSEGLRYFVRLSLSEDANELSAEEWLDEVHNQCREFADDVKAVRSSTGVATRRTR